MLALALALALVAGFQSFGRSKVNRKLLSREIQVYQETLQVPATSTHNSHLNTRKRTARIARARGCSLEMNPGGLTMGPGDPLSAVRLKTASVTLASSCWRMQLAC